MKRFYNISEPAAEAITLAAVKQQLYIDPLVTVDEDLLNRIRVGAVALAENYIEKFLTERVIVVETGEFITDIEAKFSPFNSVTEIAYIDENGASQILAPALYELLKVGQYDSEIYYLDADNLPSLADDAKAVKITGTVGFPAGTLPTGILEGVMLLVTFLHENRNDTPDEKVRASRTILRPYKSW